jgi:hypothetical protein
MSNCAQHNKLEVQPDLIDLCPSQVVQFLTDKNADF